MAYLTQKTIVIENNSGDEVFTDPELQVWTDINTLTNYTFVDIGDDAVLNRNDTITYDDATFSGQIVTDADGVSPAYLYQLATGLTSGVKYKAEIAGYASDDGEIAMVIINAATLATATQYWDKVTNDWANIVTTPEDYTVSDTASWNTNSFLITVPASGIINLIALAKPKNSVQFTGYIGRISLEGPVTVEKNEYPQNQVALMIEKKDIDLTVPQDPIKLWTIPAGYKAISVGFYIENDGATNVSTAGAYSIGTNSQDYNNFVDSDTAYPTVQEYILEMEGVSGKPILKSGDEIYFNLETVWDADKAKAKIYLLVLLMRLDYNDYIGDFGGGFGSFEFM